jgi:hypothetical protein
VAHPQIAAFARLADGNVGSTRNIAGQKTLLGRVTHGITYDPIHDEIKVPSQLAQSILTFKGSANGEEPPIRVLQGPLTELRDPDTIAEDPVHNELFVPAGYAILVFNREANGNVAPIRKLTPPGNPFRAGSMSVDPVHNLIVVGGSIGKGQPRLMIFNRTDEGNTSPKAMIGGPKSGYHSPGGPFAIYPATGNIVVSIQGGGGDNNRSSEDSYVGVWNIKDNGDVPPRWKIGGPNGILRMPKGTVLDAKNKSLIVSDKRLNAVLTFYFPEIF